MASELSLLFQYLHNPSSLSILHYLFIATLTILFLIFILPHTTLSKIRSSNLPLPPSPPSLPLLGHLHHLGSLPFQSFQKLSTQYGPIMYLRLGCVPTVVLSSASIVEEAVHLHDTAILTRPHMTAPDILLYGSSDVGFSPHGEYWRQARRICVLHLLSVKQVQSFRNVREEEVSLLVDKIRSVSSNHVGCDGVVNLTQSLIKLTNDIVCRAALGQKYSDEGTGTFSSLIRDSIMHLGEPLIGEHIPHLGWLDWLKGTKKRIRRTAEGMDSFLENAIEEHVQVKRDALRDGKDDSQMAGSDLIDILLDIQENDEATKVSLTKNNIKAIILDMFAAGTDTVSSVIEWTMAELIKNPKEMKRVQDEVRDVISTEGKLTEELVEKMTYLNAAIKETLRLHTPLPLLVPKESTKDIELSGYHIPARTRFLINAWAIGRDTNSWDRADEYIPERFLGSNIDNKGQHFEWIPFGTGRRICPGINFTTKILGFTLANLLHHFDWDLPEEMKGKPLDMSELNGFSVRKKVDLVVQAKPHSV